MILLGWPWFLLLVLWGAGSCVQKWSLGGGDSGIVVNGPVEYVFDEEMSRVVLQTSAYPISGTITNASLCTSVSVDIGPASNFSLAIWFKSNSTKRAPTIANLSPDFYWQAPTIVGMESFMKGSNDFGVQMSNGQLYFWDGFSLNDDVYSLLPPIINNSLWHCIKFKRDSLHCYLSVDNQTFTFNCTNQGSISPTTIGIGGLYSTQSYGYHYLDARFADFQVGLNCDVECTDFPVPTPSPSLPPSAIPSPSPSIDISPLPSPSPASPPPPSPSPFYLSCPTTTSLPNAICIDGVWHAPPLDVAAEDASIVNVPNVTISGISLSNNRTLQIQNTSLTVTGNIISNSSHMHLEEANLIVTGNLSITFGTIEFSSTHSTIIVIGNLKLEHPTIILDLKHQYPSQQEISLIVLSQSSNSSISIQSLILKNSPPCLQGSLQNRKEGLSLLLETKKGCESNRSEVIIGAVLGGIIGIAFIIAFVVIFRKNKKLHKSLFVLLKRPSS